LSGLDPCKKKPKLNPYVHINRNTFKKTRGLYKCILWLPIVLQSRINNTPASLRYEIKPHAYVSNDKPMHTDCKHPIAFSLYTYCYQNMQCSVIEQIEITDGKQRLGREADDLSSTKVVMKNTWMLYLHYLPTCAFMEWSRTTLTLQFTSLSSVLFCLYASFNYIPIIVPDYHKHQY